MTATLYAYEEVAEFIAKLAPEKLLEIKPSAISQKRLEDLLEKKKDFGLDYSEQSELDRFLALENLIALAKVRAKKLILV